ncbi:hypothetical protein DFH06DRAFT_1203569 [Mycena polygramma]|nr:hypothetical protein DFH06DRAFT_1203569 [Mycena polygramma]
MRFLCPIIALLTILFALATASPTTDENNAHSPMSLFRPWTWTMPLGLLPAFQVAQPDAGSQYVRRHGPRRRAVHP